MYISPEEIIILKDNSNIPYGELEVDKSPYLCPFVLSWFRRTKGKSQTYLVFWENNMKQFFVYKGH